MKTTLPATLCALALLLLGCRTLDKAHLIATVATIAGDAAALGTRYEVTTRPSTRPAFRVAAARLTKLIEDEQWDPAQFQAIVGELPGYPWRGTNGAFGVSVGVWVFNLATKTLFDLDSAPAVKAIAIAIRDGINTGLAEPIVRTAREATRPDYKIAPTRRLRL